MGNGIWRSDAHVPPSENSLDSATKQIGCKALLLPARRGELGQRVGRPTIAGLSQFHGSAERGRGGVRLAALRQGLAEQEVPLSDLRAELHEAAEQRQPVLRLTEEAVQGGPLEPQPLAEVRVDGQGVIQPGDGLTELGAGFVVPPSYPQLVAGVKVEVPDVVVGRKVLRLELHRLGQRLQRPFPVALRLPDLGQPDERPRVGRGWAGGERQEQPLGLGRLPGPEHPGGLVQPPAPA